MLDIGLRNRFFFLILTTLIFSAVGINLVHSYFFKGQKIKLIDKQIDEVSTTLVESADFIKSVNNVSSIEQTISKILGSARMGKVFIVRDHTGEIIYQGINTSLLKTDFPFKPGWVETETNSEYVRLKNVPLPGTGDLVLQVGLVVDQNFLNWEVLDTQVIIFITGLIVALFIASAALTLILLAPVRLLVDHLEEAKLNLINLKNLRPIPKKLARYANNFWAKSDEFASLVNTIQKLIDRINQNSKLTRSWSLQMAHELKTPLAIIRADTASMKKTNAIPPAYAEDVIREVQNMSEIINQFLDWTELENSTVPRDIHAVRMKAMLSSVASRLDKLGPTRIQVQADSDFSILANPIHVDQLITNLATNALKFSDKSQKIKMILSDYTMIVKDSGDGIPTDVKERIGQPFNVGSNDERCGNGLGLAWISTITKIYDWKLDIRSDSRGTEAIIQFPKVPTHFWRDGAL